MKIIVQHVCGCKEYEYKVIPCRPHCMIYQYGNVSRPMQQNYGGLMKIIPMVEDAIETEMERWSTKLCIGVMVLTTLYLTCHIFWWWIR